MQSPAGVPTITYCRIQPGSQLGGGQGDLIQDGNSIVVLEPGQTSSRYDVSHVIARNLSDEESCEIAFGHLSGGGLGAILNPVAAFVNDCVNVVVVVAGSRSTKKWSYLKRILLPFLANEILANLDVKSREISPVAGGYRAQLALSACEIQDEIISDLLRPANRNLSLTTTLEEGISIQNMHREKILDEATLRKLLFDACDNRSVHALPVGGSIDTSSAIFEFRLHQSESFFSQNNVNNNNNINNNNSNYPSQVKESFSRFLVVDLPACDPLLHQNTQQSSSLLSAAPNTLYKSLFTFTDVVQKLNNVHKAQLAPFRASKLTFILSELLGGNALVIGFGLLATNEAPVSRVCLELLTLLGQSMHFPLAAREQSEVLRGLLAKYRALLRHSQDIVSARDTEKDSLHQDTLLKDTEIQSLKKELALKVLERDQANELIQLLRTKHDTLLSEKQAQTEKLAQTEEDNVALAQTIVQLQLAIATQQEQYETLIHELEKEKVVLTGEKQDLYEKLTQKEKDYEASEAEIKHLNDVVTNKTQENENLKSHIAEAVSKIQVLENKHIEMSAELLSQVNRGDILQIQNNALQEEKTLHIQELETLKSEKVNWQLEEKQLLEKMVEKDEELLSLQRLLLQLRQEEANLTQEKQLLAEKVSNKQKEANVHKVVDVMHHALDEKKEKLQQQKLHQYEAEMKRLRADYDLLATQCQQQEEEMKRLLARHRDTLSDKLLRLSNNNNNIENKINTNDSIKDNNNTDNDASVVDQELETALQELLLTHEQRERFLTQQVTRHRVARDKAIHLYRVLFDQYRVFIEQLDLLQQAFGKWHKEWLQTLEKQASLKGKAAKRTYKSHHNKDNIHKDSKESELMGSDSAVSILSENNSSLSEENVLPTLLSKLAETLLQGQALLSEQFSFLASHTPPSTHLPKLQSFIKNPNNNNIKDSDNGVATQLGNEEKDGLENEEKDAETETEETQVMRQTCVLLAAYQKKLQQSEQRAASYQQENVTMQEQIRVLLARLQQQQEILSKLSKNNKDNINNSDNNCNIDTDNNAKIDNNNDKNSGIIIQQKQKIASLEEYQQPSNHLNKELIENLVAEVRDLRRQLMDSQQQKLQLERLKAQLQLQPPSLQLELDNSQLQPDLQQDDTSVIQTDNEEVRQGSAPTVAAMFPVSRPRSAVSSRHSTRSKIGFESIVTHCDTSIITPDKPNTEYGNDNNKNNIAETHVSQRLQEALVASETRNSLLQTRATQLEEELVAYQQYMKNVLPQYQRKVLLLQQQILRHTATPNNNSANDNNNTTKNNMKNSNGVPEKLPPIK